MPRPPELPLSCQVHQKDYQADAWRNYSYDDLADWIRLLTKRASQRVNPEKAKKDLYDADNYRQMLNAKLDAEIAEIEHVMAQGVLIAE